MTKQCPPSPLACGTRTFVVNGVVTNCGNVPLIGVKVVDDNGTPGNPADDITVPIGNLAVGGSVAWQATNTLPANFVGSITNIATATGTNICNGPLVGPATDRCSISIVCNPDIKVFKGVVCGPAGANPTCTNGTYLAVDTGAEGAAFCYRIIVSNPSPNITLRVTNMTDTIISGSGTAPALLGFNVPFDLLPGQSRPISLARLSSRWAPM